MTVTLVLMITTMKRKILITMSIITARILFVILFLIKISNVKYNNNYNDNTNNNNNITNVTNKSIRIS